MYHSESLGACIRGLRNFKQRKNKAFGRSVFCVVNLQDECTSAFFVCQSIHDAHNKKKTRANSVHNYILNL